MPLPELKTQGNACEQKRIEGSAAYRPFKCPEHERRRKNRPDFIDMPGIDQRDNLAIQHQKEGCQKRSRMRQLQFPHVKVHPNTHQKEIEYDFITERDMNGKEE